MKVAQILETAKHVGLLLVLIVWLVVCLKKVREN